MKRVKRDRLYEGSLRDKWVAMHTRCRLKGGNYGKFNVTVSPEWSGNDGFEEFYAWSVSNGYAPRLVLDRINTYGEYSPSNCRWVTAKENNRNTTKTIYVSFNGREVSLPEYCELTGQNYKTIYNRIYRRNRRAGLPGRGDGAWTI